MEAPLLKQDTRLDKEFLNNSDKLSSNNKAWLQEMSAWSKFLMKSVKPLNVLNNKPLKCKLN